MPFIKVEWIEGRTAEQKKKLAEEITKVFEEHANVSKDHVWIVFQDVKRSEWSMSGKMLG